MCSKKCVCIFFIVIYISFDVFFNLLFTTKAFTSLEKFYIIDNFADSLLDVYIISAIRDLFLTIIIFIVLVKHRLVHAFIKFVHHKYLTAVATLFMYSFPMIKLLIHADNRARNPLNVFCLIWNIIAAFLFFIFWYALSLLHVYGYKKTKSDGENGDEADRFLDTIKETNKKRTSILRLFRYSKADWLYISLGSFFLVLGAIAEAFVPYYTGQTLDSITVKQNFSTFKHNVIYFISANFMSGFIGGIRSCLFSIAVARLNVRLRRLLFSSLIQQEMGFFDKTPTGEMLSRLSADTSTMSDLISSNINGFLWNFVKTIGTLIFVFKLSWQLSLICFIGAPIVFAVGEIYGNYYKALTAKSTKLNAETTHVAEESLSTIRTVRSFANEEGEIKRYSSTLSKLYHLRVKQTFIYATYDWVVKISQLIMTVSMLAYGAHLVVTNQITSGDFMSFVIYQLTLGSCLEGLTSVYTGLMSAAGASEKVFEYLDKKIDPDLENTYKPEALQGEIEFKDISFSYPNRPECPVLQELSFKAKPGEVVALVGPSGSGKSSCLALLERFYKPDAGEIKIDGVPLRNYDHRYIHQAISLVSQEPVLYARSIQENISYGLENVPIDEVIDAAKLANAHDFIMATTDEYKTDCGERGTQLSGGQKQRIAIARSLIRKPCILLLDEATSALDTQSEHMVQQAIHKNLKGHTVIVIAHRLSTIENADKIIVIDRGRIAEQGTHKELLKRAGIYAQLVHKQLYGNKEEDDGESISNLKVKSRSSTPQNVVPSNLSILQPNYKSENYTSSIDNEF